ncbi:sorting nexin-7 isoform X2 [Tiliqua scincoides]|uniref:sorting nexin-7 isoform X2 n=1 Tax=Tiliqua scincoides TaxID=71010 RepID=UPI0034623B85
MEASRPPPRLSSSSLPPGCGEGAAPAELPACPPGLARPPPLLPASPGLLELDDDEDLEVFSKDASLTEVNSFSPLMPTSPSSMINQYRFEDEPELKDLFITVDDPESHITPIETFITYRVVTKTSRGEFDSSEYEVRRRYQDFLWLKGRLEEAHPTLIIPELSSHKKQGPGFLSRMGQTVKAVASSMRGGVVKNRPEAFTEMNDYVDVFSQKISLLDKISRRVYKEEKDYFNEMKEFGPIHTLWSASEEDLVDTLKGVAGCIDTCGKATERRMTALAESLFPTINEYMLYSEILMGVLKRRDHIQAELDSKVDAINNKKPENDLLSEEIGKLEDKVECANNALQADWDRWKQNMCLDMKSAFSDMAENNIRHYEQCLATWESFLTSQTTDVCLEENSEDQS